MTGHLRLMRQKGYLASDSRQDAVAPRGLRRSPNYVDARWIAKKLWNIPAGFPENTETTAEGCVSVNMEALASTQPAIRLRCGSGAFP